jgi:4-alpha-glucanotransferase
VPESATIGERAAGILLHPTSLPGPGTGELGPHAFAFVDWLRTARVSLWQLLPLVAVDEGGSPYNALSAFAGNPLLLSAAELARVGVIAEEEAAPPPGLPEGAIDFAAVSRWKDGLLRAAHRRMDAPLRAELAAFRVREGGWVEDYALFRALRERHGGPWTAWPAPLRRRDPAALAEARAELAEAVERHALSQLLFDRQWGAVRRVAGAAGIRVIGDLPIFVAHDSADVWANQQLFALDAEGRPRVVSGVPPDYFSETGQLWGNPLYRWEAAEREGYRWWVERFRRTLAMVDVVRVDHFRGFEAYWEVEAGAPDATGGRWLPGPGRALFDAVRRELGALPLIAEDLGLITPEVERLRDDLELPGMRVLQFAFGGDDPRNPHLPGNYVHNAVAYTGTHDNTTVADWYAATRGSERREADCAAAGAGGEAHWRMVETVLRSEAGWAVIPAQDLLGLGAGARMNVPGVAEGNWSWRLREGELTRDVAERLAALVRATGRDPSARGAP